MKELIFTIIFCIAASSLSVTEPFAPTVLKIHAESVIQYSFGGSMLKIPVTVEGTNAGLIFSIFTRDWSKGIRDVKNGYLGWHYVNKIDTCIYFSALKSFEVGEAEITWDGRDQDGAIVQTGEYYYYIWAFDNMGGKELVTDQMIAGDRFDYLTNIQSIDHNGLPLTNPLIYTATDRWKIGSDPFDETLKLMSSIILKDGWRYRGDPVLQPDNFDNYFISVTDGKSGSIQKLKFVPGGEAEINTTWGDEESFASFHKSSGGLSAGVATDGDYMYTTEVDIAGITGQSDFYLYDMDGWLMTEVDLSPWWSTPGSDESVQNTPAGPLAFESHEGLLYLYSHISCLRQMIDPQRYLESFSGDDGEIKELLLWSNGNGDYTLDKNFDYKISLNPWLCNDSQSGVYSYGAGIDNNLFVINSAYDIGAVSFGLLAPDGTGLGHFSFAGETAKSKRNGQKIIDRGTPFDGIYSSNLPAQPPHYCGSDCKIFGDYYFYFLGHDSIRGMIFDTGDYYPWKGTFALSYPVGGENIVAGEITNITWIRENGRPHHLTIEYSNDNGDTWAGIATSISISDKIYKWKVPEIVSETCQIRIMNGQDYSLIESTKTFSIVSGDVTVENTSPYSFTLSQNSPNPFNPVTSIPFTLPKESTVNLTIYSITGEKVAELVNTTLGAGNHSVDWDASGVGSGMYFARLQAGEFVETVKMTVVK